MPLTNAHKAELLAKYPDAIAVWVLLEGGKERIKLMLDRDQAVPDPPPINTYRGLPVDVTYGERFVTRELKDPMTVGACFNEPIPGGVQIQPDNANWVGTLGAACQFHDDAGVRRWGFLSNWHVLVKDPARAGSLIHQPTTTYQAIGRLSTWQPVSWESPNYFDAALADAMIDGLHTIGPDIHGIGPPMPVITHPMVGMEVCKVGRTTDRTCGVCIAIDAAVKVGYNSHTATFLNQAVFASEAGSFSAPGDSGSLILEDPHFRPAALLFAGNSELTIGSPVAAIADYFRLSFQFPE